MRSEARRGHEDQSVHEARSAECTDVSEWPLGNDFNSSFCKLCVDIFLMKSIIIQIGIIVQFCKK